MLGVTDSSTKVHMTPHTPDSILIIEDDEDIAELLQYNLKREGFVIHLAHDGERGLADAQRLVPSLILLDLMLPRIDGLTLCKRLKADPILHKIPIVMITAKSEESDVVAGLEVGADDYVRKPFSPKEVIARVRAVLRRPQKDLVKNDAPQTKVGTIKLDHERHEAYLGDVPLTLTLAEFKLMGALMSKPGRVFSREQLLEKITGGDVYVIDRNIDVHIRSIRKKLQHEADFIVTVRGVGYKCRES